MAFFVSDQEWLEYISVINSFHDDANQQPIVWIKSVKQYGRWGDDNTPKSVNINILGLLQYNHFRSWPINKDTITGEIDKESELLFLNIEYLRNLGYTNEHGQFKFDPTLDRFQINGVLYSAKGDSQTAQAKNIPLLHFIVLKREEISTGETKY